MKSKPLLAVFIIVFIDILAFTLILPYLPFFAEKFGASPSQVGFLVTVFALCQFLSGPTLGRLSDVYGRKPILALSQFGTCVGFLVLATANTLWLIFLARIIDGITAGNLTVAQATISDFTEPKDRAKAFGIIGVSFGLGFFIGPAISGLLVKYSFSAPAFAAAILSFLSILSTLIFLPAKRPENPPRWVWKELLSVFDFKIIVHFLKRMESRKPLLQFFLFNFSFTSTIAGFALFAERRFSHDGHPFGAHEISLLYCYLGLLGIIVQGYLLGKVVTKLGDRRTSLLGFFMQGLGYCLYGFMYQLKTLVMAMTIGSSGAGFTRATLTAQISRSVGPKEQGTILGVAQSLASIAAILAPIIAGFLIQHVSLESWAIMAGAPALLGFFLVAV